MPAFVVEQLPYNFAGPLLWHWENNESGDPSIEVSLEEVKLLAEKIGFEISVSPST